MRRRWLVAALGVLVIVSLTLFLTSRKGPTEPSFRLEESELNGTYRYEITDQDLADFGADPVDFAENHGIYTWVLTDGSYSWRQKAPNPLKNPDKLDGRYDVEGDRITFTDPFVGVEEATLRWELEDGVLRFRPTKDSLATQVFQFVIKPWKRVR